MKSLLLAYLFAGAALAAHAQNGLQLTSGLDYSRGTYGLSEATSVVVTPVTVACEHRSWLLRATVPYVTVDGPADVVALPGVTGGATPRAETRSESGLGDVSTSATYRFAPVRTLHLETTARVKWPAADDERGLGTGSTDVYFQMDGYRSIGAVTPFATAGYRWLGNNPRYRLRDGVYGSAGSLYRVSATVTLGASFDWRQRMLNGGDHAVEATVLLVYRIDNRWSAVTYALKGFTEASPEFGMGAAVTWRM